LRFDGWYDHINCLGTNQLEKYESSISKKHLNWCERCLGYQLTALEITALTPWWIKAWKMWN